MKGGGERAVKSERGSKENERQMESVSVCVYAYKSEFYSGMCVKEKISKV